MAAECNKVKIKVTEIKKKITDTFILDYVWGLLKFKILTLKNFIYKENNKELC